MLKKSLFVVFVVILLVGCSAKQPQTIVETIYIEKECRTPKNSVKIEWIPVGWVEIEIEGVRYIATQDFNELLGNLSRIKE